MRFRARHLIAIAAGAALVASVAGCSSAGSSSTAAVEVSGDSYDGPDVTLEFWNPFTGPDGEYFKKMVDQFNEENDNITVNFSTLQYADLYSKLPVAVSSGNGPDVAILHLSQLATVAAGGSLMGIDTIVDDLGFTANDFAPAVWDGGVYQDTRYGVPLDMHMLGLFYNKTLMAQAGLDPNDPPATAEEYEEALVAMRAAGIQGQWIDSYGFMQHLYISLLHQWGGQEFNEAGDEALWNSEAGVKALTWMQDLIRNGDSPENVGTEGWWTAFKNGESAFTWIGVWALGDPDLANVDWGVAPIPVIGDEPAIWGDSHQFVATSQIADDPDKTAAAAYFINQISADSLEWAKANAVPARASVRDSAEFKALPNLDVFASEVDDLTLPRTLPGLADANVALDEAINSVLLLQKEPKEALDEAVERANVILQDNKTKYGY